MAGQMLSSRVPGPLAGFAAGYDVWLAGRGICRRAIRDRVWQFWYLSEWLDGRGLSAGDLDRRRAEGHLAERRETGCVEWAAPSSLRLPLEYLREIGAAHTEPEIPAGPVDRLLVAYRDYLVLERRFAPRTVRGCERVARVFLEARERQRGALDLGELAAADVSEFLARESRRLVEERYSSRYELSCGTGDWTWWSGSRKPRWCRGRCALPDPSHQVGDPRDAAVCRLSRRGERCASWVVQRAGGRVFFSP